MEFIRRDKHKKILFLVAGALVLLVLGNVPITKAAGTTPVTGYAWSDNVGWIEFAPVFGGVSIDDSTGVFSGYAWSDNIGWIDFAPASGFPEAPNYGTKMNTVTGEITGWAKAIAADNNGWDGWIKMKSVSPNYGVNVDINTGNFSGYAWGSDVVGWISFSGTGGGAGYGVTTNPPAPGTPAVSISASPNPVDYGTSATLSWSSTNTTSCAASGDWSGSKGLSGSQQTGNLFGSKTYILTCAGPGGSALDSVNVNIVGAPATPYFDVNSSKPALLATIINNQQTSSDETTITIAPYKGFSSDVQLSIGSINPSLSGAVPSFSLNPLSDPYSSGSVFKINVPGNTAAGTYIITIKGNGGGVIMTKDITLNVTRVDSGDYREF